MRFVERLYDVRPGERRRTLLLFLLIHLVIAAYTMIKAARDALFLARFSVADLSYLMIALAVGAGLVLALLGRAALLAPRHHLILATHTVVAVSLCAIYGGFQAGAGRWLAWAFYLWSAVFGVFLVAQAWLLANDLFDAHAARRLWGPIGTGAILGGIVGGRAAAVIAARAGAEVLLLVVAGILMVAAGVAQLAWPLRAQSGPPAEAVDEPAAGKERDAGSAKDETERAGWREALSTLRRDRYVRLIAACVLVSTVAYTLLDWQFKGIARVHFHGQQDQLAHFFGDLYAWVSVVGLVVQVGVTALVLPRAGVAVGLYVLPLFDIVMSALMAASGFGGRFATSLALPAVAKAGDGGLRYSIDKSSLELLWLPVPTAVKSRAKPFIDTVVDRFAGGLAGLVWLLLACFWSLDSEANLRRIGLLGVALVLVWLGLVARTRRAHVRAFRGQLRGALAAEGIAVEGAAALVTSGSRAVTVLEALAGLQSALPARREALLAALVCRRGETGEVPAVRELGALLEQELASVRRHVHAVAALASDGREEEADAAAEALSAVLGRALPGDIRRVLLASALLHPEAAFADILAAGEGLRTRVPRLRASALELLDATLRPRVRRRVLSLLEAAFEPAALRDAPRTWAARRAALQALLTDGDPSIAEIARGVFVPMPLPDDASAGVVALDLVLAIRRLLTETPGQESA